MLPPIDAGGYADAFAPDGPPFDLDGPPDGFDDAFDLAEPVTLGDAIDQYLRSLLARLAPGPTADTLREALGGVNVAPADAQAQAAVQGGAEAA